MKLVTPILFASILMPALAACESWPQLGGPDRDFMVRDQGLADAWPAAGPKVLWRRELGDGYSGIVHGNDVLYTQHRDGTKDVLVAVDRQSGRWVWERELWSDLGGTPLERGYAASPIAYRDLVIVPVGGQGQSIVAFRQSDGTVAWQREDFDIAYSSPILAEVEGETQLIALLKTEVVGLDPESGRRLWMLPVSDERYVNVVTPVFTAGNLLFLDSSEGGRVLRLVRQAGVTQPQQLWVGKVIGSQVGNVIRIGDHLYGALGRSAAKFMTAVQVTTGELVWRTREIGDCALVLAGEKVIVLESDGTLRLVELSPAGLETIAEAEVLVGRSWTPPTLVGTTLYARNRREMVALDLAAGPQEP